MNKDRMLRFLSRTPLKRLFRPFYSGEGSILFLHKIIPADNNGRRISLMRGNELEVDFLEKLIIDLIKNNYEFISLDELNERLNEKQKANKKFIVFTIDDGYKDNYTLAYPIFKKFNIPFTIYITNCYPNHSAKLWWYMLEDILLENDKIEVYHNEKTLEYKCNTQKDKDNAFVKIRELLISCSDEQQTKILNRLEILYNKSLKSYVEKEALSWKDIKELSKDKLVTIGSHTMNHFALNTLNEDDLLQEIKASKEELEKKIGTKVNHFAYPFGTVNEVAFREIEIVKNSELFITATTTRLGNIFFEHYNYKFVLPRIQIIGTQQNFSIVNLYLSGFLPAIKNKLKKVVTF